MGFHCCASGCKSRQVKGSGICFYRFPANEVRRVKWVAALKRKDWSPTPYSRLCNKHFVSGQKSNNPLSPDYVPSVFSCVSSSVKLKKKAYSERYLRMLGRRKRIKENADHSLVASVFLDISTGSGINEALSVEGVLMENKPFEDPEEVVSKCAKISCTSSELPVSNQLDTDVEALKKQYQALCNEVHELRAQVMALSLTEQSVIGNDEKVKFYTGLSSYKVMHVLFSHIEKHISDVTGLTKFQQFLMTLMRLRLNLTVKDLAYRFGVHSSTVSRTFQSIIDVCNGALVPALVFWPEREQIRLTLPACFRTTYSKCVSIIDCFEVFTVRPSDLRARAQTYSSYKSHNTAKYLVSVTPQGTINFISIGWGGRASDKHITENSGYLNNLNPGDVVLAGRSFDIQETLARYGATIEVPPFTKGKKQSHSEDVESTSILANVRVRVESVTGIVRNRFAILQHTLPVTMLEPDETISVTTLDKIVHVCSAFINASEPVVPID